MTANDSLSRRRHLQQACPGYFRAFEAVVDSKAKHEWITVCEAPFHLREHAVDPLIIHRSEFFGMGVTRLWRLLSGRGAGRPEICVRISGSIVVRPLGFRTSALLADALYAIADFCAVIERHTVLNTSLVIINEEARGNKVAKFLFLAVELDGRGDCIRSARTDLSLI